MSQSWDLTLVSLLVSGSGHGSNDSHGVGVAGAVQSWPLTLILANTDAAGHGSNISHGGGEASSSQSWPLTLFDASGAIGHGSNVNAGRGSVSAFLFRWYTINGVAGGPIPVEILRDTYVTSAQFGAKTSESRSHSTYVTSAQFGAKTVSSDIFGDRTVFVHPESTIDF